jgi:hypothetical protein
MGITLSGKDAARVIIVSMTAQSSASTSIPSLFAPFFQEYDFARLDVQRSTSTIIERVLQFGNREEIRWLFSVYPRQQIADWILLWGSFVLPEPHLTFWKLVLDIPKE